MYIIVHEEWRYFGISKDLKWREYDFGCSMVKSYTLPQEGFL